jgi:hypothetical protein
MAVKTFEYWGEKLPYHDHPYNNTALNERAVELPIARHWLEGCEGRGLELGNVLDHYDIGPEHLIVDRYEHATNVTNTDVFDLGGHWDWILAISTVEHVRWDWPEERQAGGSLAAIRHLRNHLLAPGGRMLVTAPLGVNEPLDVAIRQGDSLPTRDCVFVRQTDGTWTQADRMAWAPYGVGQPWANAVWVAEWEA